MSLRVSEFLKERVRQLGEFEWLWLNVMEWVAEFERWRIRQIGEFEWERVKQRVLVEWEVEWLPLDALCWPPLLHTLIHPYGLMGYVMWIHVRTCVYVHMYAFLPSHGYVTNCEFTYHFFGALRIVSITIPLCRCMNTRGNFCFVQSTCIVSKAYMCLFTCIKRD